MTKRIIGLIVAISITIGFSGCAGEYRTLKIGEIDKTKKSMTLKSVGEALFEIKSVLINDGWKLKVGDDTIEEKGSKDTIVNISKKIKYETEYRLILGNKIRYGRIYNFNLVVINNKTNEEVLNISGGEDGDDYEAKEIAKHLLKALKEIEK